MTLWIFWIFKRCRHGLFWISMKLSHGYFEYSWSDVIGIFNVLKLTSSEYSKADVGVNIHEMTSWVFWIFKSWRHGHFEYLIFNEYLIFIQNYVVFWIFIVMTSLQEYSKCQCHYEYSKYPWRQLWIFPWRQFVSIQNTHDMNIHNTHGVSLWIFKIPMTSASWYSNYRWRQH